MTYSPYWDTATLAIMVPARVRNLNKKMDISFPNKGPVFKKIISVPREKKKQL